MTLRKFGASNGVTLTEVLLATVIGAIAMFALAVPLVAERTFWGTGKRQTEAQRDAQMTLRAIARVGRAALKHKVGVPPSGEGSGEIEFTDAEGNTISFLGGPKGNSEFGDGQFIVENEHGGNPDGQTEVLIDGVRSKVADFEVTSIAQQLVHVRLQVAHSLQGGDPRTEDEILETDLYLRNSTLEHED